MNVCSKIIEENKDVYANKKEELCSVCAEIHIRYDDGLGYLDCMMALKLKEKRDYKIEIWDIKNRNWVPQKDWYNLN